MTRTFFKDARLRSASGETSAVDLLIENGSIRSVRPTGNLDRPTDAEVIDAAGRSVVPGFSLCHFHASYDRLGALPLPVGMEAPPGVQTLRGARTLRRALDLGYTGVVSAGAPFAIDTALKLGLDEGLFEGPRFVPSSRDVSTTGHSQDSYIPWYWESGFDGAINRADGPEGIRRAVREEVKRGAQIVKLFVTGGHGVATPGERMEMSPDELAAAIEAAHERGARARGHMANLRAIQIALDHGIDAVDHGDGIDQECIDRMAASGTFLVPSLFYPHRYLAQNPHGPRAEAMKREMAAMLPWVEKANAAGVRLVLGDDFGTAVLPHGLYAEEIAFYVEHCGLPLRDVLRWATEYGGTMVAPHDSAGVIAEGRPADLLLFDGDPYTDLAVLADPARLTAVMKAGVLHRHSPAPAQTKVS